MAHGRWGLKISTRLLLLVVVMMVLTLTASFVLGTWYEKQLFEDIGDQYESVSKALQISVQQLTAQNETDANLLRDYVQRLSKSGVREISILSSEKELVASSNPRARIGQKAAPMKKGRSPLVISGKLGEEEGALADPWPKVVQELEIPIVVDDEERGFVRLHLVLDDVQALIHEGRRHRLIATLGVFALGFAGLVFLSYGMTRDLDRASATLGQVARGELPPPLETKRSDEIGSLIATINATVERLRERRALETRLRRAERMSEIGRLAAGVAHEVRNPLNLISLSVDHLGDAFGPADPAQRAKYLEVVASIREELQRLNRLVGEFLRFGRPPQLVPRAVTVAEIVTDVIETTAPAATAQGVRVTTAVPADLPPVWADPEGLRTCFVNLVVNAVQALPGGGTVVIEARPVDEAVEIAVRDDGPGIEPQNVERIFEPYFSTKAEGFGLGLAITQRIVEESGGRIRVESRPGAGTTFRMSLPTGGASPAPTAGDSASRSV